MNIFVYNSIYTVLKEAQNLFHAPNNPCASQLISTHHCDVNICLLVYLSYQFVSPVNQVQCLIYLCVSTTSLSTEYTSGNVKLN